MRTSQGLDNLETCDQLTVINRPRLRSDNTFSGKLMSHVGAVLSAPVFTLPGSLQLTHALVFSIIATDGSSIGDGFADCQVLVLGPNMLLCEGLLNVHVETYHSACQ